MVNDKNITLDGAKNSLIGALLVLSSLPIQFPAYANDDSEQYYQQALKELSQGKTGRAERLLNRVIYFDPKHLVARFELIDIYFGKRRFQEALKLAEDGIKLTPDVSELWLKKGLILRDSGSQAEAQGAYDKAVILAPNDAMVLRRASGFYRFIGDSAKAQALNLQRKQLLDSGDPNIRKKQQGDQG